MKYFKYGNSGGISKVVQREINENSGFYNSLYSLLTSLVDDDFRIETCKIIHYGFDDRIDRHVYMVLHDRGKYKEVFVTYFIEE